MLHSGMNPNLHILGQLPRKTLFIAFLLLIGLSFLAGGAMANSCRGGADCLSCAAAAHFHIPGMDVEMVNQDCKSTDQNSSCGFETDPSADEFSRIAAVAESGGRSYFPIFSLASDECDHAHLHRGSITKFHNPDRGRFTPLYLLNHSLLC